MTNPKFASVLRIVFIQLFLYTWIRIVVDVAAIHAGS